MKSSGRAIAQRSSFRGTVFIVDNSPTKEIRGVDPVRVANIGLSLAILHTAMAHREFRDSIGRAWTVWSVIPERAERRRSTMKASAEPERRHHQDTEFRVPLAEQWTRGWLAFETRGVKRRLAPIPPGWELATDEQLERMCERATPIARPPRRLAE